MASWTLVPCLVTLRSEFDTIAPDRDKSSDGSIGDDAHKQNTSDHNIDDGPDQGKTGSEDSDTKPEVHAIDVTAKLNAAFTMMDCINFILGECRKSNDVGKDRGRLKYIIFKPPNEGSKIWEASNNWNPSPYSGANPHDKHAHFSAEYDSKYSEDTSPWGLVTKFGDDVGTVDNFTANAIQQLKEAATAGVLTYGGIGSDGVEEGGIDDLPGQEASNVLNIINATSQNVMALQAAVAELAEAVAALSSKDCNS